MTHCPCGSAEDYDHCCGPLHAGRPAPTAEALMRSRYAAFALARPEHIERTCAGEARLRFDRAALVADLAATEWLGLEIVSTKAGGPDDEEGKVSFRARFRQNGGIGILAETSTFRRIAGEWRYVSGITRLERAAAPGRNDPCPCGSGLKYKKCCGRI